MRTRAFVCPWAFLAACTASAEESTPIQSLVQPIVYGEDDRVDLYEVDAELARTARTAALALISPSALRAHADGSYSIVGPPHGEVQSLCPGERFAEQVAVASCSGTLVAPDVVATTAHCLGVGVDGSPDCSQHRYVRGFALADPAADVLIAADDVFVCEEVLARVRTSPQTGCHFDLALVRLDRPAGDFARLRGRPAEPDEPLVVAGYPAGLPLKLDRGATVIDARLEQRDFFTLDSDTFAVSSGSPVFDRQGQLVGVFSRGRRDYDPQGGCQRVHHEPDLSNGVEEATHAVVIGDLLDALELRSTMDREPGGSCKIASIVPPEQVVPSARPHDARGGCSSVAGSPYGWGFRFSCAGLLGCLISRRRRSGRSKTRRSGVSDPPVRAP